MIGKLHEIPYEKFLLNPSLHSYEFEIQKCCQIKILCAHNYSPVYSCRVALTVKYCTVACKVIAFVTYISLL